MIKVISPGLLTTLQDGGRYGYQQFGVPVCGAMDRYSLNLANLLAGNEPDEGALEITFMGPTLEFKTGCAFALCGFPFGGEIDGGTDQIKDGSQEFRQIRDHAIQRIMADGMIELSPLLIGE